MPKRAVSDDERAASELCERKLRASCKQMCTTYITDSNATNLLSALVLTHQRQPCRYTIQQLELASTVVRPGEMMCVTSGFVLQGVNFISSATRCDCYVVGLLYVGVGNPMLNHSSFVQSFSF